MLGEMLRRLRESRGLKVADVVEALDAPRATIYHWEGPNSRPEPESLKPLLELYEATDEERLAVWELRGTPPDQLVEAV